MARPLRIEFEGAYYHVFSRGNKKQPIFHSDRDRHLFLKTLERMSERFEVTIFAYVLMDNHYHLLLRTCHPNLSKSMHWLGTAYTTIFNLANEQAGHLFQGRFRSILVENEAYLLQLSYYIHRNPLRAGLVRRLIDYPWSSYPIYAYKTKNPAWLNTSLIFSQFGPNEDVRKAYRQKAQQFAKEEKDLFEDIKHGVICGSQAFVDRIKREYLQGKSLEDVPDYNKIVDEKDIVKTIRAASHYLKIDVRNWKDSVRITKADVSNRDMLIYLLWQMGCFNNSEIGSHFGLAPSSISRRVGKFRRELEKNKKLEEKFSKFRTMIKV